MLYNKFDEDKSLLNPYDNDDYLVGDGLTDHDEIKTVLLNLAEELKNEPHCIIKAKLLDYYLMNTKFGFNPLNYFGFHTAGWVSGKKKPRLLQYVIGITSLINSVTKINTVDIYLGAPFDFMLHPSAVKGDEGLEAMLGLLRTFMEQGGYSFMGNVFDADTLVKAQNDPESYKNLQVRLCGWNVRFNDLKKVQQDEMIKQARAL